MNTGFDRRTFLSASALAAVGVGTTVPARAGESDEFAYEVTRSEAEWREMLSDEEYRVMREGGTEAQRSSPLWNKTAEETGTYCCKGCDLGVYDARFKTVLDKGWLFFYHATPNTILTDIDPLFPPRGGQDASSDVSFTEEELAQLEQLAAMEVHCRRCGSHLGHFLVVEQGKPPLHCVNGHSFNFQARSA